ncbi:MAG: hypothetical protein ABI699_07455 [Caldimonas sp.]
MNAANTCRIQTRLCLAVNSLTLESMVGKTFDSGQVGLILDDVRADTPLSSLACESIEAIRFSPEFVLAAGRSIRLGCVLGAMLGLARDLGLCTLGPAQKANEGSPLPDPVFDFVPSSAFY